MEFRELTDDDLPASWSLGRLAFGMPASPPPLALVPLPGLTRYGVFDDDGRLIGKIVDRHQEQWWCGRPVAAADVAGVAVLPEARGRGVARALLNGLLRVARERGAAVSALYPTVSAPYRDRGWVVAGALRTVDLPTSALPLGRSSGTLSVRPGTAADLPAVTDLYERVARHRRGLLTRRGPLFDEPTTAGSALPTGIDGLTLVADTGELVGYASWERGEGYDAAAVLTVHDVLAVTGEAARELVAVLASWRSVTPTLRLRLLDHDAVSARLPLEIAREHLRQTWMHRPVDVVRAVADRGWPPYLRGAVEFALRDEAAPWNSGSWRLEVADGAAHLSPIPGEPALELTTPGFGLLYTGAATAYAVAEAGLLRCPAGVDPAALDLLGAGGPPAQLLDYF